MALAIKDRIELGNGTVIAYDHGAGTLSLIVADTTIASWTTSSSPFAPTDTAVTATGAEINAAADVSARLVSVADDDYTVLAANSGKPHLVANVSADRTFTLPAPASGLEFEFIANAVVADGHDWIFNTGSDTNYFTGGIVHLDTDAGSAGDEIVPVQPDGDSNSKLQINLPDVGTRVKFVSDGTLWNVSGFAVSATAPAFADQA